MPMRVLKLLAIAAAASVAGCTLDQAPGPALTGPSDFGTSLLVTSTPDTLVLNGQQSVVIIEARGPSGAPQPSLRVHLDLVSGDVLSNCGRLSLTDVTTGSDGRVGVVFTAPTIPLPLPECANSAGGITIVASPVGTNAQAGNSFSAAIRFLTPTSTNTPAVFAVNFVISPNPAAVGKLVAFSDAGSISPGHAIPNSGFRWNWSDGATKVGPSVTHDFGTVGTHVVTLTITDDIGQSGSKSALITVN